jgi:hypothetical protein
MRCFVSLLMLISFALCSPVHSRVESEQQLNIEAMATLEEAITFLEGMERFEIKGTAIFDVVQESGQRLQFEKKIRLVQQRPDKLYAEQLRDDGEIRKLWYDGSQVSILNVGKNAYTQFRTPATIDGMLDMLEGLLKEPYPLADMLYSDLSFLLDLPNDAVYVGSSSVAGVSCTHLAFRNANIDWQLWVEQSATPFIRKVVITYRNQPGVPQFVAYLHEWQRPAELSKTLFSFSPPDGAERLSILLPPTSQAVEGGKQ